MRTVVRSVLLAAGLFAATTICLAAADTGGWWPFAVGCVVVTATAVFLLRCPAGHVDVPVAVWGLVEYGGIRVAGRIEERSNVNGLSFVAVTPPGGHTVSIRSALVDRIVYCSEAEACRVAGRQWVGRVS